MKLFFFVKILSYEHTSFLKDHSNLNKTNGIFLFFYYYFFFDKLRMQLTQSLYWNIEFWTKVEKRSFAIVYEGLCKSCYNAVHFFTHKYPHTHTHPEREREICLLFIRQREKRSLWNMWKKERICLTVIVQQTYIRDRVTKE